MTTINLYMQAMIIESNIEKLKQRLELLSQIDCESLEYSLVFNLLVALKDTLKAWDDILAAIENKAI